MLEPDLGRTEHVARRMKTDPHPLMRNHVAIGQRLQVDIAEPRPKHRLTGGGAEVPTVAGSRMIRMGVGDDRTVDRTPGIDVEVAGRTVESFRAKNDEIPDIGCHG